ncbi:MAG TPA: hypothetical protein VFV87_13440, partial [Pirellulaceae bacterium]|nr:hypothetical protein [Pirellulaceae bacterium]
EPNVPLHPDGQPLRDTTGGDWTLFAAPFPLVRVPSTAEAFRDLTRYEAFTCLKPGTRLDDPQIDRDELKRARYAWRKNTPPIGPAEQARLTKKGLLKPHEGLLQLRDAETSKPVAAHAGSVCWNAFRKRFVLIVCELYGTSLLGETWYAEADSPVGPWVFATKIVTHEKYSFYNPKQHPFFDQEGGRLIYFEGTYTHTFSGNEHKTPRYDYNQIMYRLDLADERLVLPVPLYDAEKNGAAADFAWRDAEDARQAEFEKIAFFALDRPRQDVVPVYRVNEGGTARLTTGPPPNQRDAPPLFWALADGEKDVPGTSPLSEYVSDSGKPPLYDVRRDRQPFGYKRADRPLCRVWLSPYRSADGK